MLDVFLKMVGIKPGHKAGKSLQSRATSKSVEAAKSGITRSYEATGVSLEDIKPQATAARRQEVKAQVKKSNVVKKASKATAKPAPKAKPPVKDKPPVKATPKPSSKPTAQSAVKKTAKPTSKTAAKKVVKANPVAKKALVKSVKSAVKPQAKPPVKGKTVAKPPVKKSVAKPASKLVAKPVAQKPAVKPEPKISAKASLQVPTQAPSKVSIKPPAQPAVAAPVKAPVKSSLSPAVSPKLIATPPVQKITKAGSRVVPSYAPSAANLSPHGGNTAAKASFTMSLPVLAPPPQVVIKKDPKLAGNWKTKSPEQLSDQEVIAMPDSEYMNAKQLAFFRLKLVGLKNGILANAGETTEHLREDTSIVPDPADRATIEEEHALELRTRDRERKLLKKIEQSIASIDADEYGYCDETGEPIGVARLIARPTATLSLEAQQRRELKQKMFGD